MSALHHQELHQAALLPELAPPADQPARFAVWGLLDQDAHVFVARDGTVQIQVVVRQHLQSFPEASHVLATYTHPPLDSVQATELAAHAMARRMRTCAEVVVTGSGLVPGVHRGRCVSVLLEVRGLCLAPDIGAPSFSSPSTLY